MIETFHIGFNDIAKEKIYKLELSEEQKEALGFNKNKNDKTIWDYFDNYLNDKKLKEYLNTEFTKAINKTLPKEVKEGCLYCTGNDENIKEEDRKCYNYHVEGQMNEFFAVWWFVNIVENNKQLLSDKEALKKLSIKLYECFLFKDGRVFFDLRKLTMYCLEQGFLTLSKIFAKNDKINSLEIINQAIENLDSEYLSIKMFEKTEPYHIEPQKMFLESKRKSIKEQLKIDRLKNKQNPPQQTETSKPKKLKKTLLEFIYNVENKEAFIQDLKNTFPTEIGKSIKAIIDFLNKEQILIYGTKEFKQLFEELEKYFNRNIGTYNSVQNVKEIDKETNDTIFKILNPLIIKYKSK